MPKRVCVAIDSSPVSAEALKWASTAVIRPEDECHVVCVLEPALRGDFAISQESGMAYEGSDECKPDPLVLQRTQQMLLEKREELKNQGITNVKLTTLVSCVGGAHDIGRHINEYAQKEKADMLVMGSRGMSSMRRAMLGVFGLGSISEYVVKHSPCNVVVHKQQPQA